MVVLIHVEDYYYWQMDQDCFPKLCLSVTAPEFRIRDRKSSAGSSLLLMVANTEHSDDGQEILVEATYLRSCL